MSVKSFEKKVLARPGAKARVEDLEHKILVAQGLVAARKKAKSRRRNLLIALA